MYVNQYLLHARIAESKMSTFIQGHCLSQMKKSVQYTCDIQILRATGFIEGTHCECAVVIESPLPFVHQYRNKHRMNLTYPKL